MRDSTRFPGFTAVVPVGADVAPTSMRGADDVPVTYRLEMAWPTETMTVLSTYRSGVAASHVGWLEVLLERGFRPVDQIEGELRFPPTAWGELSRDTVYIRPGRRLGCFYACSSDWVLDVLAEVDEDGKLSEAADRFLRSVVPEPEPNLDEDRDEDEDEDLLAEMSRIDEGELPGSQDLSEGQRVELRFRTPGNCFDVVDAMAMSVTRPDERPGPYGQPAGVWGTPSWRRIRTLANAPISFRLVWQGSAPAAFGGKGTWEHIALTTLDAPSGRLLVVPDIGDPSRNVEVTLPAAGVLRLVVRVRGLVASPELPDPQYELELSLGDGPDEPTSIVDSRMLCF